MNVEDRINIFLEQRKDQKRFRKLKNINNLIDFSSNDYLGFSRSAFIRQKVSFDYKNYQFQKSGATGSRLLNGNSALFEEMENFLAKTHHAEAALLFNSGFDANVGLLSTVIRPDDTVFYDEFVHASIHQGIKLSESNSIAYKHNNLNDLEDKLKTTKFDNAFIITESVFSMEGDMADLKSIVKLALEYKVELIVDEAHATGIYGKNGSGLCNEAGVEKQCFARIYTFGKAIGSHGAVVVGSNKLKEYLINYSKNFIYSTALETHTLLCVKHAYLYLQNNINQQLRLNNLICYFKEKAALISDKFTMLGKGPIFGIIISDTKTCLDVAEYLQLNNLDVRAILAPTVPLHTERLRVIIHSFNSTAEIDKLFSLLIDYK